MHPEAQQTPEKSSSSQTILCVGEALVDLIAPPADGWSSIDHFVPRIGGAPANTSVAIRRLGGHSAFLGCLADDPPGGWIRERLAAEGVDLSRAFSVSGAQTRLAVVTGSIHDRSFDFYGHPAADTLLTPENVRQSRVQDSAAVILGSLLLLSEPGRSAMHELLEQSVLAGVPITFDPNPRPATWPDPVAAWNEMRPFIRHSTILKLGVGEPAVLGATVAEIRKLQPADSVLILTDGPKGCWYWYGEQEAVHLPSMCVQAVDSTGAGDAFTAALTLRYLERNGNIARQDLEYASAVGALTTTSHGAMDAIPTRAEVERFIESHADSASDDFAGE